jgi:predicted regulator of Ras-like GTPase activity (Roadblock/LC7/MglB family)
MMLAPDVGDGAMERALSRFVQEAGVRMALVVDETGAVIAQRGFTKRLDLLSASSLAAAIHASSKALGREIGDTSLGPLHHEGKRRHLFLAPLRAGGVGYLLLAVFENSTSIGIVRVFWDDMGRELDALAAAARAASPPTVSGDFGREAADAIASLFSRG